MDGSSILRTGLLCEIKHLVSIGKVMSVSVYEVTRDQAVDLI